LVNGSVGAILLVEDDPNDVLLIQRAFRKARLGNPIHVVRDGEEAIEYLSGVGAYSDERSHPLPELMLLDMHLPKKSGVEVLAWLRGVEILKRLPVVVLTASREQEDINRAFDSGANAYLVKPGTFDDLLESIP
jgi:CheY-like chemotaxis protein